MASARKRHVRGDDMYSPVKRRESTRLRNKSPVQFNPVPSPPPATLDEIREFQARQDDGSVAVVSSEVPVDLPYDICFGMLLMEAACTYWKWNPPPENSPVQITCLDNRLMLCYEGSERHAGILVSKTLSRLIRECSVTLVAFLNSVRVRPLRVTVYGLLSEKDTVTNILDEGGLFLQRPEESDYDRRVRYHNPMYLLPSGEDMPKNGNSFMTAGRRKVAPSADEEQLGEVERSRILRLFDEFSGPDASIASEVKQSSRIISTLKDHQLEAVAMMIEREQGSPSSKPKFPLLWEAVLEGSEMKYRHIVTKSPQRTPLPCLRGGILADEMGLGKTLSALALICHHIDKISDLPSPQATRMSRATLIVTPKSTIYGWQQQIERHIRPGAIRSVLYHGAKRQDTALELHDIDLVLTTYDTLRSDWTTYGPLYIHTWSRIILDEAHRIRNRSSQIFRATCEVRAHNRWCLTGTPIQNSLGDFGSLLAFIGVPPFVTREQFRFWISSPILSNQQHSLQILRKLVRATCLRRTKAHPYLASTLKLPRKTERVEIVELAPYERELYNFFKRRSYLLAAEDVSPDLEAGGPKAMKRRRKPAKKGRGSESLPRKNAGNIIVLISVLRMICDHGETLLPRIALEAWPSPKSVSFAPTPSSKVSVLLRNVLSTHQSDAIPLVKSVIFSHWTGMLDLISDALSPHLSCLDLSSVRIDGSSSLQQRRNALDQFNSDNGCMVMLATIGAVGEGIDLSVASEVHIVEPHWNPMAEAQAVDRVHRIGQIRDVKVTRYCVKESIEEYIQWVQTQKVNLIKEELVEERWEKLLKFLK
ncbi:Helicase, C-terminal [Pleurostoma richardsiae]|uniref:Helicase, C-terminal n=1 Tax=Pleurostoma richardsiae TaxID=41990 RepID=A0AA38RUF3_9PEZI|nr:Helicase, C-terminal [Pleurostoma richardsiae]